jgi:hypothetical protein
LWVSERGGCHDVSIMLAHDVLIMAAIALQHESKKVIFSLLGRWRLLGWIKEVYLPVRHRNW